MPTNAYPFADGNRLEDRNTYFYVPYRENAFLEAWRQQRDGVLATLPSPVAPKPSGGEDVSGVGSANTEALLDYVYEALSRELQKEPEIKDWLGKLVKKFEVTKRIHTGYDDQFRALDRNAYKALGLYVRLAGVFEMAHTRKKDLITLNAFLKCLDTLCSLKEQLSEEQQALLAWLIEREGAHVNDLAETLADR
jgi:hypothetical protein